MDLYVNMNVKAEKILCGLLYINPNPERSISVKGIQAEVNLEKIRGSEKNKGVLTETWNTAEIFQSTSNFESSTTVSIWNERIEGLSIGFGNLRKCYYAHFSILSVCGNIIWHSIIFCVKVNPIRQMVACKASMIGDFLLITHGKNIKRGGNPIMRILYPQTLSKVDLKPSSNFDRLQSNVTQSFSTPSTIFCGVNHRW